MGAQVQPLPKQPLTQRPAWKALSAHHQQISKLHLRKLFADDPRRGERMTAEFLDRREVFGASASSAFYRRSVLDRVGPFPESFGAYFDDVDLSCRLRRTGGIVVFEPESRVIHHGGSSHVVSRRLVEQQSCNEERLYWRNSAHWRTLPRHCAVLAGKAMRRWNEGRLVPWTIGRVRAWATILSRNPNLLRDHQFATARKVER